MTFKKTLAAIVIAILATTTHAAVMHVHDSNGNLGMVDTTDGSVSVIGNLGVVMTDIAFDSVGNLYGISFDGIYLIDALTASTTLVGGHGIPFGNALVFDSDGTLYAAGNLTTDLFTIDLSTGIASSLGSTGFNSGGDLAFANGGLYLSSINNELVSIDLNNVANSSTIGLFGVSDVFGIASPGDGTLFGVAGTTVFEVDLATGMAMNSIDFGGQGLSTAFGQSFFSEAVVVPVPAALQLFISALALCGLLRNRRSNKHSG